MIITRTPFRISFFGGGTDYPVWFKENGGSVLATSINKYCYISARYLPPFFEYKSRVVWSKLESVQGVEEIQHPCVRTLLKLFQIDRGISINHDADLPARSGIGSSSTFTVSLLHALYGLKGILINKSKLAQEAIDVEQKLLNDHVGCQDQIVAAYGGFNQISFSGENQFDIAPVTLSQTQLENLQNHLLLFFTGISRTASDIAKTQIERTKSKTKELREMHTMVETGIAILKKGTDFSDFGRLLHESWLLKRGLTDQISTPRVDEIYEVALSAGALGGKLLGAGGGGFLLLFAPPESHAVIKTQLSPLLHIPFRFENSGSQIIFYEPQENG